MQAGLLKRRNPTVTGRLASLGEASLRVLCNPVSNLGMPTKSGTLSQDEMAETTQRGG